MYKITSFAIFIFSAISLHAQQSKIDSLNQLLSNTKADTAKICLLEILADSYRNEKKMDSSVLCYKKALEINKRLDYSLEKQLWNIANIDYILYEMGNYLESLEYVSRHLELGRKLNDLEQIGGSHLAFGHDYRELGEFRLSLDHYFKAYDFFKLYHRNRHEYEDNTYTILCISQVYLKMKQLDSAMQYARQAYNLRITHPDGGYILLSERMLGHIYFEKGDDETALQFYRQYIPDFVKYRERNRDLGFVLNGMAKVFQKREQPDSAVFYSKKALANGQLYQDQDNIYNAANLLYNLYKDSNEHEAFKYFKIATMAKDSMASVEKIRQIQILTFNEQIREKQLRQAEAKEAARRKLLFIIAGIIVFISSFLAWNRIRQLRTKYKAILDQKEAEKLKTKYQKELLELEAKALRAQMNPHFIFNCLNSIKSLIQEHEEEKSVSYLTTFSKLIRTLLNNADKKEITLHDEIETCKLYLQLEAMRFDAKFSYSVTVDENIDLKSIYVPALIVQPFIENAIWHGIVPCNSGGNISLDVVKRDGTIEIIIEDDGIGRKSSQQNKSASGLAHVSKGVNLTQSRLELNNLLQQRCAQLEIIDKEDETGIAKGTKATIKINEEAT